MARRTDRIPQWDSRSYHCQPKQLGAASKLKTAEGSNASLLGPPAVAAQRQLLSIPVSVAATVPDGTMVVLDPLAVLSAHGAKTLAVSEHAAFRSDSIVTRLTFGFDAAITHRDRVVELSVPSAAVAPTRGIAKKAPASGS